MRGICNRRERITGYKNGPQKGTIDFKIELIPVPPPTPEKFQRKARIRRLKQQWQQFKLTNEELEAAIRQVEADYEGR
jgi:hypothetical protein